MKKFIITIDTEGDNLWEWKEGNPIATRNTYYLRRFQKLCDKYSYKPVYLSNWEMLQNEDFIIFIKESLERDVCELGMHLHAWNTPPFAQLPRWEESGKPYLIEYSTGIMENKIRSITELINEKFGFTPLSHRAGRWAMNNEYFKLLRKYGYKIDCSYTPGIDWSDSMGQTPHFDGPDYRKVNGSPQIIHGILEVPVTLKKTHQLFFYEKTRMKDIMKSLYHSVRGKNIWLRPDGSNLKEMLWLIDDCCQSENDYLMFMLHSSELMPGGSPKFRNKMDIEELYVHLEIIFQKISRDYEGITLKDYYEYTKDTICGSCE